MAIKVLLNYLRLPRSRDSKMALNMFEFLLEEVARCARRHDSVSDPEINASLLELYRTMLTMRNIFKDRT